MVGIVGKLIAERLAPNSHANLSWKTKRGKTMPQQPA